MSTLAQLATRIGQMVDDAGVVTFSADDVAEGLRQALYRLSRARPLIATGNVTLAASGREISISSLTGLIGVKRVWLPYLTTDEEPNWQPFEVWPDLGKLYMLSKTEPQAGDIARVFYSKLRQVKDLDSAAATTVLPEDETLLCIGAAGYAVLARARSATEAVMLADQVPLSVQIMAWAKARLAEFEAGCTALTIQAAQNSSGGGGRIQLGPLDKWDRVRPGGEKWS